MKKLHSIVSSICMLAVVQCAAGQSVGFGITAGINASNVSTEDPEFDSRTSRSGLIGGAFLSVGVLDMLSIRPEALYSQKGVAIEEGGFTSAINADYIEIPLLLKISTPQPIGPVRPHLMLGPALSFLSSCWVYDGEDDEDYDCDEVDVELESKDFGFVVGAGLDLSLGPMNVSAGGRYTIGTQTVDADPDPIDIKNRVWSFTVSVGVKLVGW